VCGRSRTPAALATAAIGADTWLNDDKLVSSVEKQVRNIQPTRIEKRFDEIGWAPSILRAEELARKANRPVFLLFYNGKIDTGQNWKGRFKDNSDRMRTGSLFDGVEVLKGISFGHQPQ
jgi:hypothetical protein